MENQQPLNLFITYVEKEGPFLKVWGQTEKHTSLQVEHFLVGASTQFDLGVGKIPPESIYSGSLVCAKYKDNKYYRARVSNINYVTEGLVEVIFLDYGNKDVVPCRNIRAIQTFPVSLITVPPLATGFIFAEAHCPGGGEWNEHAFESISKELRYREVQCSLLVQATQYYLVKLFCNSNDLGTVFIRRGLMQPISLQAQQAVLLSMSIQRQGNPVVHGAPAEINTYKAATLEPGNQYLVYVSYINDGPCHFSVQLKQSEDILVKLMAEINAMTLKLLEDVPIPGTVCLAKCLEDDNVCRAVVTNEVENQFKVFYVDFGNYEVIPLEFLYHIPFKYVIPKVMAIRFALAGIEKSTLTLEMKCAFKKFVDERPLIMKVLPSSKRTAVSYCELWDPETKISALEVVNRAAMNAYPEAIALHRGFSQQVKVSFVFSCSRFYVQLTSKESELVQLMQDLQASSQVNDSIDRSSLKVGLPCCSIFETDGQWYRSEVVEISSASDVKIRYIDYGNEEVVPIAQLRQLDVDHLTVLRPQAIECCLNGYQNMEDETERDNLLEELILENQFNMKVVEMTGKKVLVELIDNANYNVASLLLDKLAAAKSQVSPMLVQDGHRIEHRKNYQQQTSRDSNLSQQSNSRESNFARGERKPTRERDNSGKSWTEKPNDNSWRNDKDFRNNDRNSNEPYDKSWRQNNRGFNNGTPERFGRDRENNSYKNDDEGPEQFSKPSNDWNTTQHSNDRSDRYNNQRDGDFRKKERFDGGQKGGGGGGYKKKEFRREGSEMSSSGSERSYNKGPRTSSRNDRFNNKKYEKPQSAPADEQWNFSSVSSHDVAIPSAQYSLFNVAMNSSDKVQICWFHNPGHFFCQLVSAQHEIQMMMDDIQQAYKQRTPEGAVVGQPVIGLFPEDNVLYRAKVLEVLGSQYKVYYVDFGNVSCIDKVWAIDKKFMSLSVQAICCGMYGVAPAGEAWLDADSYGQYFDQPAFDCTFLQQENEKVFVNLASTSGDIGQQLVQNGLAIADVVEPLAVEVDLLVGQQFRGILKSVNNLSDIIISLQYNVILNCKMHNLETATETYPDKLKKYLEQMVIVYVDNVIEGILEVTLYDTEGNKIVIVNPDEEAFDSVEALCPALILQSTLYGFVSHVNPTSVCVQPAEYANIIPTFLEQLFEYYESLPQSETIIPEEGQLYAVCSSDANWYRARVVSFDDEQATMCYIDYGNTESVAFSKLRELTPQFMELCAMCLLVNVTVPTDELAEKDVVLVINYGDNGWEGVVNDAPTAAAAVVEPTPVLPESTPVLTESTPVLTESTPPQPCRIEGPQFTVEDDPEYDEECRPKSPSYTYAIVMEQVEKQLRFLNDKNVVEQMGYGSPVIISHIDSPSEFYLQLSDTISDIEQLQQQLQEQIVDMPVLENPTAGVLCAAPYSVDQQWYRAQILDADSDITTVRFVDYGNTDVIDNKKTQIKTLPPNLLSLEMHATRCSLRLNPMEEEWSTAAITRFEELTTKNVTSKFWDGDEKTEYVDLFVECKSVKDQMVSEKLGLDPYRPKDPNDGPKCFVSHLNSPAEFWIQLENCVDELESVAEQLSNAETFSELEDSTPGTLCAALFPDDCMWYRARILSNTVAGIEVLFIDYGNSCISHNLRQLPEELLGMSPLAQKCCFAKPDDLPTWPAMAVKKFSILAAGGQTIFTLHKISAGETSVVELIKNKFEISRDLLFFPVGYVKNFIDFDKFKLNVRDEMLPDYYRLEPLEGVNFDDEARRKFLELNKDGTTLYQLLPQEPNTVILFHNDADIRYNLVAHLTDAQNDISTEPESGNQETPDVIIETEPEAVDIIDVHSSAELASTESDSQTHDDSVKKEEDDVVEISETSMPPVEMESLQETAETNVIKEEDDTEVVVVSDTLMSPVDNITPESLPESRETNVRKEDDTEVVVVSDTSMSPVDNITPESLLESGEANVKKDVEGKLDSELKEITRSKTGHVKIHHDDKIVPAAVSRPHTPLPIEEVTEEKVDEISCNKLNIEEVAAKLNQHLNGNEESVPLTPSEETHEQVENIDSKKKQLDLGETKVDVSSEDTLNAASNTDKVQCEKTQDENSESGKAIEKCDKKEDTAKVVDSADIERQTKVPIECNEPDVALIKIENASEVTNKSETVVSEKNENEVETQKDTVEPQDAVSTSLDILTDSKKLVVYEESSPKNLVTEELDNILTTVVKSCEDKKSQ